MTRQPACPRCDATLQRLEGKDGYRADRRRAIVHACPRCEYVGTSTKRRRIRRRGWCIAWRSHVMPAPAFWYFPSKTKALSAGAGFSGGVIWQLRRLTTTESSNARVKAAMAVAIDIAGGRAAWNPSPEALARVAALCRRKEAELRLGAFVPFPVS